MHGLTKPLSVRPQYGRDPLQPIEVKKILLCRPNKRLGNLLLITPLLQEIARTFPGSTIDLFIEGNLGPVLFENYGDVGRIIKLPKKPFKHLLKYMATWISLRRTRYDLAINVIEYSSSGKISTVAARARYKFLGEIDEAFQKMHADYYHAAKRPVYTFRYHLAKLGMPEPVMPVPLLDLKLSPEEIEAGQKTLHGLVDPQKATICLFTYATGDKCYSASWWTVFYERLQSQYADYNILEVLPKENVSQIAFRAPTFYSLDVREIGALIANTRVFIGADSGMMHLSSAARTPTIGLFSITDEKVFGPYGNGSVALKTGDGSVDAIFQALRGILG